MQDNQARLAKTQLQVATGRRILTPSDDPSGAKRILDLKQSIEVQKQYQRNADSAINRLSLEEATLANVTDTLHRVRELAVQAGNSTLAPQDRRAIAAEVEARLDEMLALANTRDAQGEYLFAGYRVDQIPFSRQTTVAGGVTQTSYAWNGDANERRLQVGASLRVSSADSGQEVFRAIATGNGTFAAAQAVDGVTGRPTNQGTGVIDGGTVLDPAVTPNGPYTLTFTSPTAYQVTDGLGNTVAGTYTPGAAIDLPGQGGTPVWRVTVKGSPAAGDSFTVAASADQDLFQTVQNFVDALNLAATGGTAEARFQNALGRTLTDLDRALDHLTQVRAGVGARLNEVEAQRDIAGDFELYSTESLSTVEDLDYAEATGRLQLQLTVLQASQQAFVRVQGLSLFNYL
ncbi:MAG: flagellar hook-associated protein FlgL [Gammaproteobacteria bacterium]|nr:flagellar hook-associated protein FlgL [Gammaproteobacteria bacterium]